MKRSKLFSLIELLIVVAVISILMSLLQPAFQRTIRLAKNTLCQNNERNLAFGTSAYASDHNGQYMERIHGQQWAFGGMGPKDLEKPTGLLVLYTDKYLESGEYFYCPSSIDKGDNIVNQQRTFPLDNPIGSNQYHEKSNNITVSLGDAYFYTFLSYMSWMNYNENNVFGFEEAGILVAKNEMDKSNAFLSSDIISSFHNGGYASLNNHDFGEPTPPEGGNFLFNDGSVKFINFVDLNYTLNHPYLLNFYLFSND